MTETTHHPVDLAIRALTTTIDPSRADFDYARNRLTEAISTATRPPTRTRSRRSWAIGLALLMVIAVFLVQTVTSSPASALITELAEVALTTDPLVIPDDQFGYIRIDSTSLATAGQDAFGDIDIAYESVLYSLSYARESWIGDEGTVRQRTTYLSAAFLSPADESAYYAAGLDKGDHLGETIVETQLDTNQILDETAWPTDPVELEATIRSHVGDDRTEILQECLGLLREPLLPPELRSAVLLVIAGLDPELVDESPDGAATFSVGFEQEDQEPMRLTFTLDTAGHLTFEELVLVDGYPDLGVPPGTVDSSATYSVPFLVDRANLP